MIIQIFSTIKKTKFGNDGDIVDRVNHKYTVWIFLLLAVFLTTTMFTGERIKCMCPAHFKDSWIEYSNNLCWIKNTYYIPMGEPVELAKDKGQDNEIEYYQWVPLILSIGAVLFYLPRLVWMSITQAAGIDMDSMITSLNAFSVSIDNESRKKTTYNIAMFIDRYLDTQIGSKKSFTLFSRSSANYMGVGYIAVKVIYLINILFQAFVLEGIMGEGYATYGAEVMSFFTKGVDWSNPRRFPRNTFCDIKVRQLSVIQPHTLQCVLPINLYNEKAFLFIWWWLLVIFIVTFFNLLGWISRIYFSGEKLPYVKKYLMSLDKYDAKDPDQKKKLKQFVNVYLKPDGVFVLRLLARNTNTMVTADVVCALWDHFLANYDEEMKHRNLDEPDASKSDDSYPTNETLPKTV